MSATRTMRNAFIRISAKNNTSNGLIEYSMADIKQMVESFCDRYSGAKYAYICHDKDTTPDGAAPTHYHIFFRFKSPVHFPYIKEAFPYGDIERVRSANACVQYLIHKNNPEKAQYSKDAVFTNMAQDEFDALFLNNKKIQRVNEADELEQILQDIADCKIRRFNMGEYISVQMYSKYRTRIENAFRYRDVQAMTTPNRAVRVIFVTGDAGNGKTTFAKGAFCGGYQGVCVSSSSNDPLQDYTDQDVLILDDLRDDDFKFQDLLKILDPHTSSSVKSRYNNKVFMGKLIIITSYKKLDEWYSKVPREAKKQLYRRISLYVEVGSKEISIFKTDEHLHKELFSVLQNTVPALVSQITEDDTVSFVDEAITSYYASFKGLVPDAEIERGLASVKNKQAIDAERAAAGEDAAPF